jgi:hypothetical protein
MGRHVWHRLARRVGLFSACVTVLLFLVSPGSGAIGRMVATRPPAKRAAIDTAVAKIVLDCL